MADAEAVAMCVCVITKQITKGKTIESRVEN